MLDFSYDLEYERMKICQLTLGHTRTIRTQDKNASYGFLQSFGGFFPPTLSPQLIHPSFLKTGYIL